MELASNDSANGHGVSEEQVAVVAEVADAIRRPGTPGCCQIFCHPINLGGGWQRVGSQPMVLLRRSGRSMPRVSACRAIGERNLAEAACIARSKV